MTKQELAKRCLPSIQALAEGLEVRCKGDCEDCGQGCIGRKFGLSDIPSMIVAGCELEIVKPPAFRPWNSIEEMGEAINWWFRIQGEFVYWFKLGEAYSNKVIWTDAKTSTFLELFANNECTPTPWLPDSWRPCGVKEGNSQ